MGDVVLEYEGPIGNTMGDVGLRVGNIEVKAREGIRESNTLIHARREIGILLATDKDSIIAPFAEEILAIVNKFGNNGESGGSAPYIARILGKIIEKLCLFETLCPIQGTDDEWGDVASCQGELPLLQNNRCSGVFKNGADGRPYYIDAIIKQCPNGQRLSGRFWRSREDYLAGDKSKMVSPKHFIKSFPFTPKTFYIDVNEEEIKPDDWEMYLIDPKQLEQVWEYYDEMK